MTYLLIFHTDVEDDVAEAYNWYENQLEGLGERFLTELAECYTKILNNPEFYGETIKMYRRLALIHFPYIVVYELSRDKIFVYAVFHTSRNPKHLLKRER